MYIPKPFEMEPLQLHALLRQHGAGDLVTATSQGLLATFLPFVHRPADHGYGVLLGHLARNNPQWRETPVGEAMVILRGGDAYVSPQWYASKAEHGRVVPTWNYVTAHVYGSLIIRDDPDWLREHVTGLTDDHESSRLEPWRVTDAPAPFVDGQLKAIVGLELRITHIEAKAKLSQNRSAADVDGVVAGYRATGDDAMARLVEVQRGIEEPRTAGPAGS